MIQRSIFLSLLSGMLLLGGNNYAAAQSPSNVLLVINDASEPSQMVGDYYAKKRAIPAANICHITTKAVDTLKRDEFERQIQQPVAGCITAAAAQDRILYIVLTKGVPIRIDGTGGRNGTVASVDSELTLLYHRLSGGTVHVEGPLPNPYFAGSSAEKPFKTYTPFSHQQFDIYLVTRLDGYTVSDVIKLIDRGSSAVTDGHIVLDGKSSWVDKGNEWLRAADDSLKASGFDGRVEFDATGKVLTGEHDVLGYYSWGSNDPSITMRHFNLTFVPGALAAMFVSSDARTFKEPPDDWSLGDWNKKETYYAGSPQSLTGDLIRDGVTGVAGHVAEPFLDATIRPDILFPAYISGANLAESYYQAMPYLSWQTIVIGDPLCAPFRRQSIPADTIDQGLDPRTELPVYLSQRRLQAALRVGLKLEAVTALMRAEARLAHKDTDGAMEALVEATKVDSRLTAAQALLGGMYLAKGRYEEAANRYRKVLAATPNEVLSMNNLAYILAVHLHAPEEALPIAERAVALVKNEPSFRDTLGWIQHLVGRDQDALASVRWASANAPGSAEVHWHAAVVLAANDELGEAGTELNVALKLDPKVAEQDEVRKLQARIGAHRNP